MWNISAAIWITSLVPCYFDYFQWFKVGIHENYIFVPFHQWVFLFVPLIVPVRICNILVESAILLLFYYNLYRIRIHRYHQFNNVNTSTTWTHTVFKFLFSFSFPFNCTLLFLIYWFFYLYFYGSLLECI